MNEIDRERFALLEAKVRKYELALILARHRADAIVTAIDKVLPNFDDDEPKEAG